MSSLHVRDYHFRSHLLFQLSIIAVVNALSFFLLLLFLKDLQLEDPEDWPRHLDHAARQISVQKKYAASLHEIMDKCCSTLSDCTEVYV